VPVPREGCNRKGTRCKKWEGNGGGGTNSPHGVAFRWFVGASASVVFPCTVESRRWRAIMEEVDEGCREFWVTIGTITRTAGILIHSRLKVLAVNLSQIFRQLSLYASLIASNNPRWLKAP